jgi:integrase
LSKGVESILIPLPATGLILSSSQQSKLKFEHLSEGLPGDRLNITIYCLEKGYGSVYLPFALEKKYKNVDQEWIWQFVFPSDRVSQDPRSKIIRRHHLHESGLQKALKQAVKTARINKQISCHTFCHSFATERL